MTGSRKNSLKQKTPERVTPVRNRTPRREKNEEWGGNDDGPESIWDFDAPQYYDFENSKTPGNFTDKWFDYAHPTPAIRTSRHPQTGMDSILSNKSIDSLIPNRPSLTPSRVVSRDGRLVYEDRFMSAEKPLSDLNSDFMVESVEFSDTDEEIEFNNWKRAQLILNNGDDKDNARTELIDSEPNSSGYFDRDSIGSEGPIGTTQIIDSDIQPHTSRAMADLKQNNENKLYTDLSSIVGAHIVAPSSLTLPEERGFMRPTEAASRRISMKKREKIKHQELLASLSNAENNTKLMSGSNGLTHPKPFHFHETRRRRLSIKNIQPERQEQVCNFIKSSRAAKRKANKQDAENENVGQEEVQRAKRTRVVIPKTPEFATDKRIRSIRSRKESHEAEQQKTQKKQPLSKKLLQPMSAQPPLKHVVPKPFKFRSDLIAERHLLRLREQMARLREEEEALRQFRANPLPDFPTPKKPNRERQVLHVSPFKLQTNSRGESYQKMLRDRLDELERRRRERMLFRARPIPSSIDTPFVPHPSAIPLTQIEEILLKTELRSEERRAYDEDRMERERIRAEMLERRRREEELREEAEIKRLRKLLVPKAQPIRHYKPVVIKPSDRPLTIPKTPNWHIRTRKQASNIPSSPTESPK